MSTLYDLVNVYEKSGAWLGQFMSEAAAKRWMLQTGRVPAAHLVAQTRPVDGKLPEE